MEKWDLYDTNKVKIEGIEHIRDSKDPIPEGMYHMAISKLLLYMNLLMEEFLFISVDRLSILRRKYSPDGIV